MLNKFLVFVSNTFKKKYLSLLFYSMTFLIYRAVVAPYFFVASGFGLIGFG